MRRARLFVVSSDGSIGPPADDDDGDDAYVQNVTPLPVRCVVDVGQLTSRQAILNFISQAHKLNQHHVVSELTLTGHNVASSLLIAILEEFVGKKPFLNQIVDISISHILFKEDSLTSLCSLLNPRGLRAGWQRLRLLRCGLGSIKVQSSEREYSSAVHQFVASMFSNTVLEQLDLTGNNCGDEIVDRLIECLTRYETNLRSLALNSNNLTSKGMQTTNIIVIVDLICNII